MACARDDPFDTGIHSLETNGGRSADTRIDAPIRQLMYSTSLFSPVPKKTGYNYVQHTNTGRDRGKKASARSE